MSRKCFCDHNSLFSDTEEGKAVLKEDQVEMINKALNSEEVASNSIFNV